MTSRDGKVFCAESEQLLKTWVAGIRLAKVSVVMAIHCCYGNTFFVFSWYDLQLYVCCHGIYANTFLF